MKIEQGKSYRRIADSSESFKINNVYKSPFNRMLVNDCGFNMYADSLNFEEVKEKHMIKVIGLDGKEVQQKEQEKPIEILFRIEKDKVIDLSCNFVGLTNFTLLSPRNSVNAYDLMKSDSGYLYFGNLNSGLKHVPGLKPIELFYGISTISGVNMHSSFFSEEHIKMYNEVHLLVTKNKGGASMSLDVIKFVSNDFEHVYLGHWNDGILPTFD